MSIAKFVFSIGPWVQDRTLRIFVQGWTKQNFQTPQQILSQRQTDQFICLFLLPNVKSMRCTGQSIWTPQLAQTSPHDNYSKIPANTVKPLLSGHLRDHPKCPLTKGCKNCAMFVNDQHSTVTLYYDKVACC